MDADRKNWMWNPWVIRTAWGVILIGFPLVTLVSIFGPRLFAPTISDDCTHQELAVRARERGVSVKVEQVNATSAVFTDPNNGARVAVIRAPDRSTAEAAARAGGWRWEEQFTAGPFFVGAANDTADADLCRRLRRALR